MNSLKPIIKKTVQALTLFVYLNTYAQELDSNLFYCNENIEIKYLWPVGQNQFVANVRYLKNESFSGEQMYLSNMYLLFNESNLVTDTVYISSLGRSVNVLDDQTLMFTSKFGSEKYDISEEKFNQISNFNNPNILEVIQAEEENEYMQGTFNGIEIGYISEAKNRTLKRSKKNIPRYFYIDANGNRKFINSEKEDVVNDQWESFLNKMPFALGDINLYKDELYINIPMIGTCYVFNTKNFQIKTYLLPTEDADSWFLNLDKKTGFHYLIGHKKDETFDIYRIDLKNNHKTFLQNVEGFMDLIYDDQILYRKETIEGDKQFFCYYFEPVYKN